MNAKDLRLLRTKLKSGEYDGTDIMSAWIAIDSLIDLLEQNRWIPVSERLPEEDENVFVCSSGPYHVHNEYFPSVAYYVDGEWYDFSDNAQMVKKYVNYWKPLPNVPEDV